MSDYPLPNASTDLTGQVALVTGASSGLGERFARVLAAPGAKVALARAPVTGWMRWPPRSAAGGTALAVEMDATDADQLTAAVDAAESGARAGRPSWSTTPASPTPSGRTRCRSSWSTGCSTSTSARRGCCPARSRAG